MYACNLLRNCYYISYIKYNVQNMDNSTISSIRDDTPFFLIADTPGYIATLFYAIASFILPFTAFRNKYVGMNISSIYFSLATSLMYNIFDSIPNVTAIPYRLLNGLITLREMIMIYLKWSYDGLNNEKLECKNDTIQLDQVTKMLK